MTHYTADPRTLAAELSPDKVYDYLVAQGYHCTDRNGAWLSMVCVMRRADCIVEVPLNPNYADYGRRMYEALEALDGAFLGLLHAIDPRRFPRERILALAGVTP